LIWREEKPVLKDAGQKIIVEHILKKTCEGDLCEIVCIISKSTVEIIYSMKLCVAVTASNLYPIYTHKEMMFV